jgi:hypothetical protein
VLQKIIDTLIEIGRCYGMEMSVEEIKANGKKGKAILYRPKKAPSAAGD